MELFRLKFSCLGAADIKRYLELNRLDYAPLPDDEISDIKAGLYESTMGNNLIIEKLDFFKVPFTDVLDLVRTRKCYIKGGFAYVSTNEFTSVVATKHEQCIQDGLTAATRLLPVVEQDERIFHLIKSLHTSYTGKDYTVASADAVPIESLDQLSKKSFPLCMRVCHETLRAKHHLKHGGRMQFGLFLKAIGVTLEDSMRFWQEEFTKIMDYEKFQKSYAYNIRHNYGKEGSMISYTPHSCLKIIGTAVAAQDVCGCPFKQYDPSMLRAKLSGYGLSAAHVQEVATLAQRGHPQLACGRYFEITMDAPLTDGISHPNGYFEQSQLVMLGRQPSTTVTGKNALSQRLKREAAGEVVVIKPPAVKRGAADTMDAGYDEELWLTAAEAESNADQTQQLELMADDDDFDLSQVVC